VPNVFENNLPRRLRFGRGISGERLAELGRLECSKPFSVTDAGAVKAGLLDRVTAPLAAAGMRIAAFDNAEPEPPFSCVADAVALIRGSGQDDAIVALGGGSVVT